MKTLREWRLERVMSVRELAQKSGLSSHKTIIQLEQGRQRPQYRTMRQVAEALGVEAREVTEFAAVLAGRLVLVICAHCHLTAGLLPADADGRSPTLADLAAADWLRTSGGNWVTVNTVRDLAGLLSDIEEVAR